MLKYLLVVAGLFVTPILTSAHTRWFTEGTPLSLQITEPTVLYLCLLAITGLSLAILAITLHQKGRLSLNFLKPQKRHAFARAAATFTMVTGAFFLIAGTHHYLFSPNLTAAAGIPNFLVYIQIAIGLSFLLGVITRFAAMALGTIWFISFYYTGTVVTLENIWVLGTALFIMVMGNDYFSIIGFSFLRHKLQEAYKHYALSILRLSTGATLLILGFSEKILAPELGVGFLATHHWNFMHSIGLDYSNYLFTLSAGTVEILFGTIFILGVLTRLNALVVTIVFILPLFFLGPIELAGHLPHFASIILLMFFGNGGHFIPFKIHRDREPNPR